MSVTTYDLGTVLMVPKGDWNSTTAYERLNLVRHNGTAWLCTVAAGQTSLNEEPSSSATNWEILVQDQSSVTSVNGQRGDVVIDESGLVHKAGTETITGDKTFTGTLTAPTPDEDDESTKVATTEWVKNTTLTNAVGGGGNNLFDVKWSDHRLNDMSWLRSDTFSWHNGEVYSAAYQELLSEYNNRSDQTVYKAFVKSNYTAVGDNIKEWRGIVQGFNSNTDYITHPVAQPTTSMEYVIKVYTSTLGSSRYILGGITSYTPGIVFIMSSGTGQLNLYLTTNGSSWNIASNVNSNCTLPANTWKWFKLIWNGSTFTVSESLDGINYTQKYSVACAAAPKFNITDTVLGAAVGNASYTFTTGKFDLQECYFKADGNTIWKGADYLDYVITDKKYRVVLPSQTENLQRIYNDYGVAWYYVLDSTNTRFKLPRTKFGFTGLRSGVGEFVEAGLPNIAGSITNSSTTGAIQGYSPKYSGAYVNSVTKGNASWSGSTTGLIELDFDASQSNSIYGNSNTVQPHATEMYLYHYVGDFNRQAVLANIGVTSENIDSTSFLNTPVGTIIWSMANSVPAGYLICNGQAVGRLAYPELFAAIGTTYGSGDGDSTFNLPNLIGKFVEGNATAGIEHEAGLPNIEAGTDNSLKVLTFDTITHENGAIKLEAFSNNGSFPSGTNCAKYLKFNASNSNSIYGNSNTVQPPSLTAMPCIKAFDAVTNDGTVDVNELIHEVPARVYNTREVITTSGTWTAPLTGWYKITCIGGGGAGGMGGDGGNYGGSGGTGGGTTTFGTLSAIGGGGGGGGGRYVAGGGGGAGRVATAYRYFLQGSTVTCTIGAGAVRNTIKASTIAGTDGTGNGHGYGGVGGSGPGIIVGTGAVTAQNGQTPNDYGCSGGAGGTNGTGYGSGGGGGAGKNGSYSASGGLAESDAEAGGGPSSDGGYGGAGGNGAVILEYFNPATSTN